MGISVHHDGGEIVIRVKGDAEPTDTLVAIAAEPLAVYGLELKPVLRLADDGALKTVAIGRRRFTKLSYLLALVDTLPAANAVNEEESSVVVTMRRHVDRMARRAAKARGAK
jgi:hypothetical protein